MKCIHCGKDCKYKERADGRCPGCKKAFAFEPQKQAKLTDSAFLAAIMKVSSDDTVAWGAEHLLAQLRRRKQSKVGAIVALIMLDILVLVIFLANAPWHTKIKLTVAGVIGVVLLVPIFMLGDRRLKLSDTEFRAMLERWCKVHGVPKRLIVRAPAPPVLAGTESDLGDYSFDRAVICDRARTVDLLVANNFHFENNCAILGYRGYPERIFQTVRKMLARNPKLKVYVLHDATGEGCRLAWELAQSAEWFKGRTIIDVGLRPEYTKLLHDQRTDGRAVVPAERGVSKAESAWLSTSSLELAVLRPEQVIKRLFHAMTLPLALDDANAYEKRDGFYIDRTSFGATASASDGGGDSFG